MKTSLGQVALAVLCCTIAITIQTDGVNPCKRQPFRGRCPSVKSKGPTRSQFVLRYYLRDNECVSYPFGHCADDENEPMLYRYKEECEKACLKKLLGSGPTDTNDIVLGQSTGPSSDRDTSQKISTKLESSSVSDVASLSQRTVLLAQKITPHKLLTECERRRQASQSGLIRSKFIPVCTSDGSFRALQCETEGNHCFCVDHNGIKIPNSSSNNTTKPDCKKIIKAEKPSTHECSTSVDPGPCTAAIGRWYYEEKEQQCILFEYSGCGGNGNNYPTEAECEKHCKIKPTNKEMRCKNGLEPLRNDNGQLVNCDRNPCPNGYLCFAAQLGSACCPISLSNKTTATDSVTDICKLPKERGPCDRYELRFYYNSRLGECKYFFFGGCEGNANNFERAEECERICRNGMKIDSVPIVSPPQLITLGPQMRKLNKEFADVKKIAEDNELVQFSDTATSTADGNNKDDISGTTGKNTSNATISKTTLEVEQTNRHSTTTTVTTAVEDLSTSVSTATIVTDQNKQQQLLQKIDSDDHKKMKQKGTKILSALDSKSLAKVAIALESENIPATPNDFNHSDNESNRNSPKSSSDQQSLSNEEQIRTETITDVINHATSITRSEGRSAVELRSSSTSSRPLTSRVPLPGATTQLISTTTIEAIAAAPTENTDDRCMQRRDRGSCVGQFIRWHWDSERHTCQVFTYSGCGGNGNNFRNREDCFATCHHPPKQVLPLMDNVCEHSIHPGDCKGTFQRFAFDSTIGDCRPFTYSGCGGNGNNFGSSLECRNKCIKHRLKLPTDVCQHPIEVGECAGVFPRFAYDLVTNECRPFTYGGCGGNGNNFGSMAECKTKCVREQSVASTCPPVDKSLCMEPCILFSNRRGCQECTCPVAQPDVENGLVEPVSHSTPPETSSSETSTLEAEQSIKNEIEGTQQFTLSSARTSQGNPVTALGEKCSQPMDAGPCKNFIERWFFDSNSGLCEPFQYGGCAGNRNHFFSRHECEIHCARFFNGRTGRRRIAAYQSASHAQHNTLTWPQSVETLNEHEHEEISDNEEEPRQNLVDGFSNGVPSFTNSSRDENFWKHTVKSDSGHRVEGAIKPGGMLSRVMTSAESNDLHFSTAFPNQYINNVTTRNFPQGSIIEQHQQYSRSSPSLHNEDSISDIGLPQTTTNNGKQILVASSAQQRGVFRHQVDDKWRPIFSSPPDDGLQSEMSALSESEIIPAQGSNRWNDIRLFSVNEAEEADTETESIHRNIPVSVSPSAKNPEDLNRGHKQFKVQKTDFPQKFQQRNKLPQQTPPTQKISQQDERLSKHDNTEDITLQTSDIFDSQIARKMLTDLAIVQNSQESSNAQITAFSQPEISQSQKVLTDGLGNKLRIEEKGVEKIMTNTALISDSASDNSVNHKFLPHKDDGSSVPEEMVQSVNSKLRRLGAENEIYMKVNKASELWKEPNQIPKKFADNFIHNHRKPAEVSSKFPDIHMLHKEQTRTDIAPTQISRDSVLRHRVRIINQGSVFQAPSSDTFSLPTTSSPSTTLPNSSSASSVSSSTSLKPSSGSSLLLIASSTTASFQTSPHSITISSMNKFHHNTSSQIFHSSTMNKTETFTGKLINASNAQFLLNKNRFKKQGARSTHLQHATSSEDIAPSVDQKFSRNSALMHTNSASSIENEVSVALSNSNGPIRSAHSNDMIVTQERSNLPQMTQAVEWDLDSDEYRIIDRIDTTPQTIPSHDSLTSTTTSISTSSAATSKQSAIEVNASSLVAIPITLSAPLSVLPSVFSTTSTSTPLPTTISSTTNVTSTISEMTTKSVVTASQTAVPNSTIVSSKVFASSFSPVPKIRSEPLPPGKSWLYDGLQSIVSSQSLSKEQSQQAELSDKKLSSGSFNSVRTSELATATENIMNTQSLHVATLEPEEKVSIFTNGSTMSVKQIATMVQESQKPIKGSDENRFFSADSSIFLNTAGGQQQHHRTGISHEHDKSSVLSIFKKQLVKNSTKETAKEKTEGRTGTLELLSKNGMLMDIFGSESVESATLQFASSQATSEVPSFASESTTHPNLLPHKDNRIGTVGNHSSHPLKHQLQQSFMENFNEFTRQKFTTAHDIQMAQSTSSWMTIKQDEIDEEAGNQTTVLPHDPHQTEKVESETSNQEDISDSTIRFTTTPHALHDASSLQKLEVEQDERCVLPPDAGNCRDYILRWFYNSQTGNCEQFSYGSCGGNSNNFPDRNICEAKCSQGDSIKSQFPERCTYKKNEGHGNGYNVKWYFNMRNLRCEQMVYQGEGGNANQFETLALDSKILRMDSTTAKWNSHSSEIDPTTVLQPDFTKAQEREDHQRQAVPTINTREILTDQHHKHGITSQHGTTTNSEKVQKTDSGQEQHLLSSSVPQRSRVLITDISNQNTVPATPVIQISHNIDSRTSEIVTAQELEPELSSLTSHISQNGTYGTIERKVSGAKTFASTVLNGTGKATVDLSNIFEDIGHAPSCPNGFKPMQHSDGRPVMCLPGRNQCSSNSLCYFNGVDFFCCPNAEDPYDEHVFGGYGGEEVKRGYKSAKKMPINGNELIVRKLRLRRQAKILSNNTLVNKPARIDSRATKYSVARATNISDGHVHDVCIQEVDTGKCTEAHLRYFYDYRVGTCRLFYYSGCGGNENNFATEGECQQKCKNGKIYIENPPPGSCPYGEPPLGDNAPVICGKERESFECPKGYYCRMGPPNVCCLEKFLPALEKILLAKKTQKNVRFAPQQPNGYAPDYQPQSFQDESKATNSPLLIVPPDICPDGSDALLDESTQKPLKCGSGFDGQSLCPVGYYCSIDSERDGRLCCQLEIMGVKIPPPPKVPPYFGLRPSNPGEIIPRGSLPSDYHPRKHQGIGMVPAVAQYGETYPLNPSLGNSKLAENVKLTSNSYTSGKEVAEYSESHLPPESNIQDAYYGRMMLKPRGKNLRSQALYNALGNVASPEAETNEVQIDVGEVKDPFESSEYTQKATSDRSICLLKPNEGRTCREDESPPRTNLQYFYSNRDKRCKLYFYRGCGGSQNRFDTKRHCELTCSVTVDVNIFCFPFSSFVTVSMVFK
uniref:Uncharacterized protein n=1 Tax=Setaria digitata TaxID=48799 RepID=A0A915Q1L3_9BILA